MLIRKPSYYDQFHCIASSCPDSCCQGWDVEVDRASALRYLSLPGELGHALGTALNSSGNTYWMENIAGHCPMWRSDGLCRIQAELGEAALCQTCRDFPRLRHDYGCFTELGLELSCPEAARLILTVPWISPAFTQLPNPADLSEEIDREALELLLRSRETALSMLESHPPREGLALLLLFGIHVQNELDGGSPSPFLPQQALEDAASLATDSDPMQLLPFFHRLEILTPCWRNRLDTPRPGSWQDAYPALARYFVERYWLQAVSDYDLYSRVKLTVLSCLVIHTLGGDFPSTAQLYSKEIENDADNLDRLLDAAYQEPAFTDDRLLGLLLLNRPQP